MSDNISRQAVQDALEKCGCTFDGGYDMNDVDAIIADLPSTDRYGEWIYCEDNYGNDGYRCDKCGYHVPWDYTRKSIHFIEEYNFCPNCGADMRGGGL